MVVKASGDDNYDDEEMQPLDWDRLNWPSYQLSGKPPVCVLYSVLCSVVYLYNTVKCSCVTVY